MTRVAIRCFLVCVVLSLTRPIAASDLAPDFNLRSPEGRRVHLKSMLEDGPVLLDFWATWCKPCVKAMPKIQEIHDQYHTRGLIVVGVNEDGPRGQPTVKPFLRARKLTFPIALDLDGGVRKRMRVSALPSTVLIDQDGEIVFRQTGFVKGQEDLLIDAIESVLGLETSKESASE